MAWGARRRAATNSSLHPLRQNELGTKTLATGREPEAMKPVIVPLAALGMLAVTTGAALAAPPAYCALYAREYASQFALAAGEKPDAEPKIQDEAYYRCLNMDQEPQLPVTSAYYGTSVDTAGKGTAQKPAANAVSQASNQPAAPPSASVAVTATPSMPAAPPATATVAAATPPVPTAPPAAAAATPPVSVPPPQPIAKMAGNTTTTRSYTGGKTPWTPEWFAACKKYFPNSFNEKDGTILPHGSNKRVLCR